MQTKKLLVRILIIIMFLIIIVLSVIIIKYNASYKKIYEDLKEPRFGYYLDRESQITNLDLINHNSIYMAFFEGKHTSEEIIKLLTFLQDVNEYNKDNEYLYVTVYYNSNEYQVNKNEQYETLCDLILEAKNYSVELKYNENSGFINYIIINKI